jgi:hypothetical protein
MPDKPYLPPELLPQKPAIEPELPSDFHIGEEFGTAKKNLPPWKIVSICLAIVIVVVGVLAYLQRPKPQATGAIQDITAVELPGQNSVLVAITLSFKNNGEKGFWIHSMRADLATQNQTYSDEAAPVSDFDRYLQAAPALKEHALKGFKIGDKIDPGTQDSGTILVSFPVNQDAFNSRKNVTVTIWPDDQPLPLVLTK